MEDLKQVEEAFRGFLIALIGQERFEKEQQHFAETPMRVAKAYTTLLSGYNLDPGEILKKRFKEEYDEIVLVRDIDFVSFCAHHLLPFVGKAHVAYLPKGQVVGISKLARLVMCYAARLQVQEHMTRQIIDALMEHLAPKGAMVVIEAKHMCMTIRGIEKQNAVTVTSAVRGCFQNEGSKMEVLKLIQGGTER